MSPPDPTSMERLRQAADRLTRVRRAHEQSELGLAQLQQSRERFIHSLRNTGLSYAQAKLKFDNCLEEQRRLQERIAHELDYAERFYAHQALGLPA
ncbi:hypothetical protein [Bordetella trematum]|uniref:hypothetical protein n=1 Tax=Bordetella trematum TaxID=123899 RepID=UPI000D91CBCF|nr:hypothetical protein [Bordetella trematum]SPU54167.1 Uncharacterised protein [Bordetella trematum]VDH08180.1 Uncharacterised protein [Bordetella trematum]